MAEEVKFTLKSGMIAAATAALIMAVFGCLWGFHGRVTILETQHANYMQKLDKLDKMEQLLFEVRQDQIRREIIMRKGG